MKTDLNEIEYEVFKPDYVNVIHYTGKLHIIHELKEDNKTLYNAIFVFSAYIKQSDVQEYVKHHGIDIFLFPDLFMQKSIYENKHNIRAGMYIKSSHNYNKVDSILKQYFS